MFGCPFWSGEIQAYLEHVELDLELDNQAHMYSLSHSCQLSRISWWIVRLSSFKYEVPHIRCTQNVIADTLSQIYDTDIHIPVPSILLKFLTLYEDTGTHQQSDAVVSTFIDGHQEELFLCILC
jgi:hypothetical protein